MFSELHLSSDIAKNRQFPSVDIAKFICAFLVIMIHVNPFSDVNPYAAYIVKNYVARIAVPFFFVSSGYFCFRKTDVQCFNSRIPVKYAKRILELYLIWTLIYLPIIISGIVSSGGVLHSSIAALRSFLLVGSYTHLWYLLAVAVATLIVSWMIKRRLNLKKIATICLILYTIGLLGTSYFELLRPLENLQLVWRLLKIYKLIFITVRNGLFFGTIFIAMGAFFAYKEIYLRQSIAITGFMFSIILMFVEAFCVYYFDLARDTDMYVFLIPVIFFLFYIVTHIEIRESSITINLRKYSSIIYFVHLWVNFALSVFLNVIGRLLNKEIVMHSFLQFAIVAIGSLTVSIIIVELQKREPFRWLKILM